MNDIFEQLNQDIRNLLEEKGFEFGPIREDKTSSGLQTDKFRVTKEDKSFIIIIKEVERLSPT